MPLPLSTIAITEKNRLATSDSVFLLAMEIAIPSLETPIRVVANTANITWRTYEWIAFPFSIQELSESGAGEVPRVEVQIGNVGREMEGYLHGYDLYCKQSGPAPIVCDIFVVNTLNLDDPTPEVQHTFELLQPRTSPAWVTFVLGAGNPWLRRFPQRRLLPVCQWVFRAVPCDYDGGAAACDKTLARCRGLNNAHRFGGFYATGR